MSNTALRPFSLHFEDDELEVEYLHHAFSDYAGPLRAALAVGVFLIAAYAGIDRYLFGHFVGELVVMRAVIFALGIGLIGLTYYHAFARWVRPGMSVLHVVAGLAMIHLTTLHPSYAGGLYAVMVFFALLARAQFQFSTFINAGLLVAFAVLLNRPDDVAATVVDVSVLFSAVVVISLGAYVKERSDRIGFVQERAAAEARDRALAANRAKSTFLANMSHELRTPLNAVIGYGEMLQEDMKVAGLDDCVADLEKIVASGKHLLGLINDILDLAKIEAGKVEVLAESFDVRDLVDDVAATVKSLIERNGNRLERVVGGAVGSMRSDSMRVRQILMNLLSNAAKFTKQGTITIEVRREHAENRDWIVFCVKDTGIGMTTAQQDRIFDAFRQADASTTRDYGGTGLGLTITMHFSSLLGGEITVSSKAGEGSQFDVKLPSEPPAA